MHLQINPCHLSSSIDYVSGIKDDVTGFPGKVGWDTVPVSKETAGLQESSYMKNRILTLFLELLFSQ